VVVQVLFAAVAAVPELHQHALREAAVQVQPHGVAPRRVERHTAARLVRRVHAGDALHLGGEHVLHAGGAGEKNL